MHEQLLTEAPLSRVGFANGLDKFVLTSEQTPPPLSAMRMARTVQAMVGAVHLDGGDRVADTVLDQLGIMESFRDRWAIEALNSKLEWKEDVQKTRQATSEHIGVLRGGVRAS
jgi:dsRNA-specific ribonuclease